MEEYIVTAKRGVDLEDLYHDIEKTCNLSTIPCREITCLNRRSVSRNTHYLITKEEADLISSDPRVEAVSLPLRKLGYKIVRNYEQTGSFDKSFYANSQSINWGVHDVTTIPDPANWGWDGDPVHNATTRDYYPLGENVDIIISDSPFWGDSVDLRVDEEGLGDSRYTDYDWSNNLNSYVTGFGDLDGESIPAFGQYQPIDWADSHGMLCATVAAGTEHGIAKKANVYHLPVDNPSMGWYQIQVNGNLLSFIGSGPTLTYPYGYFISGGAIPYGYVYINGTTTSGGVTYYTINVEIPEGLSGYYAIHINQEWGVLMFDYIRAFHRYKDINPNTNRRNPTVVNASWGLVRYIDISEIDEFVYRGTEVDLADPNITDEFLENTYGLMRVDTNTFALPADYAPMKADLRDAEADGVIFSVAAGNDNAKMTVWYEDDFDNYVLVGNTYYYYHRGDFFSSYGSSDPTLGGSIIVGAMGASVSRAKASFSNSGPRVDVFAPGQNIVGMLNDSTEQVLIEGWSITNNLITFKTTLPVTPNVVNGKFAVYVLDAVDLNIEHDVVSVSTSDGGTFIDQVTCNYVAADSPFVEDSGIAYCIYTQRGDQPRDLRFDQYYEFKSSVDGTSFAAPQVTGWLACLLSNEPRMSTVVARINIFDYATYGKMYEPEASSGYSDPYHLQNGINFTLASLSNKRPVSGLVYPTGSFSSRTYAAVSEFVSDNPTAQVYPRTRLY